MIISDSYKFIFVHVQKTGGTSIRAYFDERVEDRRIVGAKALQRDIQMVLTTEKNE